MIVDFAKPPSPLRCFAANNQGAPRRCGQSSFWLVASQSNLAGDSVRHRLIVQPVECRHDPFKQATQRPHLLGAEPLERHLLRGERLFTILVSCVVTVDVRLVPQSFYVIRRWHRQMPKRHPGCLDVMQQRCPTEESEPIAADAVQHFMQGEHERLARSTHQRTKGLLALESGDKFKRSSQAILRGQTRV